jgi:nicotinamide-nucleotide amidase
MTANPLIAHLREARVLVAVAESCTGGMLSERITAVPGASEVYVGGIVAYANEVKTALLGVPAETLETSGAVSPETAVAMAQGVRQMMGADLAAATTGIAGPGGGTPDKPVGLVYVAVAGAAGELVQRHLFHGDREAIRRQACDAALAMLQQALA